MPHASAHPADLFARPASRTRPARLAAAVAIAALAASTPSDATAAVCCPPGAGAERAFAAEGPATFFGKLFDTSDYPARWYCGTWSTDVGWLHIVSDVAIFAAYAAIPAVLLYWLLRRRDDIPFPHVVWLFGGFILSCGLGHLLEAVIFWWPAYRLAGLLKAITAIVSCVTVVVIARLVPKALDLPGISRLSSELNRQNAKYRALFESDVCGVIVCGFDGTIREANDRFLAIVGYSRDDLESGRVSWREMTPLEHVGSDGRALASLEQTGRVEPWEKEYLRKDGSRVPVLVGGTLTEADDECICFVLDISEQKRAEARLQEATKTATAANAAKSEFLANMSHEIRTPLNGILGFADVLRRSEVPPELARDYIATIHSSGRHLLNLINDILDLSKIEAGQFEYEIAPTSPVTVMLETLSVLRVPAEEKGLSLEPRWITAMPETIRTDEARLRQLLTNVVGNAVKFTERGSVTVAVAVDDAESDWPQLRVEVHDTGIGIAEEAIDRIFSPFAQADTSITREFGGTGLGLSICRQIAEGLGGTITVTSRPQVGSTFAITLPTGSLAGVPMRDATMTECVASTRPTDAIAGDTLAGLSVLVCEDGKVNRDLITLILADAGAAVVAVVNGREGLDAVTASPEAYDVVLMDMQMPVMDGYTAAAAIRELGYTRPVHALTAHAMSGDAEKARVAGCDGYLTKPIDIDELIGTLLTCPTRSAAAAKPVATPLPPIVTVETFPAAAVVQSGHAPSSPRRPAAGAMQRIRRVFVDELADGLASLDADIAAGAFDAVARFAHATRGSAETVGFGELAAPLLDLEQAATEGDADATRDAAVALKTLGARITAASGHEFAGASNVS